MIKWWIEWTSAQTRQDISNEVLELNMVMKSTQSTICFKQIKLSGNWNQSSQN